MSEAPLAIERSRRDFLQGPLTGESLRVRPADETEIDHLAKLGFDGFLARVCFTWGADRTRPRASATVLGGIARRRRQAPLRRCGLPAARRSPYRARRGSSRPARSSR